MKQWLRAALIAAMTATFIPAAAMAEQSGSGVQLTAKQKFDELKAKGIFSNFPDGTAGLDQSMNRAKFAEVSAIILGLEQIGYPAAVLTEAPFNDTPLDAWYVEQVAYLKEQEIMLGDGNGNFRPEDDITVQELGVVAARLLGLDLEENARVEGAASYAGPYIQALLDAGIEYPTNYSEAAKRELIVELAYVTEEAQTQLQQEQQNDESYIIHPFESTVYEPQLVLSGTKPQGFLLLQGSLVAADQSGNWSIQLDLVPGLNTIAISFIGNEADPADAVNETIEIVYDTLPVLEPQANRYNAVNHQVALQLKASDADGDELLYGGSGLPPGLQLDPDTGWIQGTLLEAGVYNAIVNVSEKGKSDSTRIVSQTIAWTVAPPVIYTPVRIPDTTPPYFLNLPTDIVESGASFQTAINETGWIYAVPVGIVSGEPEVEQLEQWASDNEAVKVTAPANTQVVIDTALLPAGSLYLYAIDRAGNRSTGAVVTVAEPETDPGDVQLEFVEIVWHNEDDDEGDAPYNHVRGVDLIVTVNKDATVYLIDSSSLPNELEHIDVHDLAHNGAQFVSFASAQANSFVLIPTESLDGYANLYYVIAVDEEEQYIVSPHTFQLIDAE